MIVILGKDKDFSQALSEQVTRELGHLCECAEELEQVKTLATATLVVNPGEPAPAGEIRMINLGTPPFRLQTLLGDIANALRPLADEPLMIGPDMELSLRAKSLRHVPSGKTIELTDKETLLLRAVADAPEGVVKDELLKTVWGIQAELNTHTLETHIYRLRAKIKDVSGSEMIEAAGGGYRLQS